MAGLSWLRIHPFPPYNGFMNMNKPSVVLMVVLFMSAMIAGCKKDVTVSPSIETGASPSAAEAAPAMVAAPVGKTTTITIESTTPGSLELALPVHSNNQRVKFEELKDLKGKWEQTFGGERIRSLEQGSGFTVVVITDKPEIPFLQTLDGATVKITYDGQTRSVSLKGDRYDWRPEKLY